VASDTHLSNLNPIRFSPFVIKRHEMMNEGSPQMMCSPTLFFEMYKMRFRRARIYCITQAVISSPPFKWTYDFQWWRLWLPHPLITQTTPYISMSLKINHHANPLTLWDPVIECTLFLNLIRPPPKKNEWFKRGNVAFTLKIGNFIRKKPYSTTPPTPPKNEAGLFRKWKW
jgi:hypothetical protein